MILYYLEIIILIFFRCYQYFCYYFIANNLSDIKIDCVKFLSNLQKNLFNNKC